MVNLCHNTSTNRPTVYINGHEMFYSCVTFQLLAYSLKHVFRRIVSVDKKEMNLVKYTHTKDSIKNVSYTVLKKKGGGGGGGSW